MTISYAHMEEEGDACMLVMHNTHVNAGNLQWCSLKMAI